MEPYMIKWRQYLNEAETAFKGKQWVAPRSYNLGREGFDQVLKQGSVFRECRERTGDMWYKDAAPDEQASMDAIANAKCTDAPWSKEDPLYYSALPVNKQVSISPLDLFKDTEYSSIYEVTAGGSITYTNPQLVRELKKIFG
jgi:hypothetical protein